MSSSSSISLLRLHHPFSTPVTSTRKQQRTTIARSSSGGGGGGGGGDSPCSVFTPSPSPPPPYPPAGPRLAVQRSGNRASGAVYKSPQEEGRNGVGRREAIGLGVCLNAFSFFFQGAVGGRGAGAEAAEEGQCSLTVAPSGLAFCDRVLGFGAAATKGQLIKAHYVGKLEDGKVFDSSYARGKPLTFRVGVGEVIKGWDQGILGDEGIPSMLSGGKRTLRIPPELAYGVRGAGCRGGSCIIPPNSTLFFDVEFIGKA